MNLASIIDGHPAERAAFRSRGQVTTYGELCTQVAGLRAGLGSLGVVRGDRVAIVAANNPLFVISYLATVGMGAVAVPLNPASPAAELKQELAAVGAKVAVIGPTGRDALASIGQGATAVEHVLVPDGVELADAISIDALVAGATTEVPMATCDPDDLAVLVFTSGTAGSPRAAMLSHGNLLSNIEQMQAHPGRALQPDDVSFGVLPLFHIFGLNVSLGLTFFTGASVVLVERFDPVSALQTITDHGITVIAGAPPMYQAWATMPGVDPAAMASVRIAVSGASALPEEVYRGFNERFGIGISQGYGLTEASPTVTSSVREEMAPAKPTSVGVPLPGVEVRLVDDEGHDVFEGDVGEIWVRGPNVFMGYWHDPDATAVVLTEDGWLRTGDIATVDDDGWLYLVDRAKDLIIVSGFNVYPAEVECVIAEHPGVEAVAVVGVDHPYSGETVKAFVVASPGRHLEEDELIEFAAGRLARYKCPTKVTFVEQLPQGAAGKVLRRALH